MSELLKFVFIMLFPVDKEVFAALPQSLQKELNSAYELTTAETKEKVITDTTTPTKPSTEKIQHRTLNFDNDVKKFRCCTVLCYSSSF